VSPTIFRVKQYRFFFFSREEQRVHVHVVCPEGEAKFWLDPKISLAKNLGLRAKTLTEIGRLVEEHEKEIRKAWEKHFGH
jgi:hypothetical protein